MVLIKHSKSRQNWTVRQEEFAVSWSAVQIGCFSLVHIVIKMTQLSLACHQFTKMLTSHISLFRYTLVHIVVKIC